MNGPPFSTIVIYGILPTSLTVETKLLRFVKTDADADIYKLNINNTNYFIRILHTDKKIGFVILKGDLLNE